MSLYYFCRIEQASATYSIFQHVHKWEEKKNITNKVKRMRSKQARRKKKSKDFYVLKNRVYLHICAHIMTCIIFLLDLDLKEIMAN